MILHPADWYAKQDTSKHFKRPIDGEFENRISAGQKKRIRKCEAAGMAVVRSNALFCYKTIEQNRERKGRKYGMSREDWDVLEALPDTAYCFMVTPWFCAVGMCVRVAPKILYVSAWAHEDEYAEYSPVCLLAKGIYNWCGKNGFDVMDIGIGGDPGLDAFKERLGFYRA